MSIALDGKMAMGQKVNVNLVRWTWTGQIRREHCMVGCSASGRIDSLQWFDWPGGGQDIMGVMQLGLSIDKFYNLMIFVAFKSTSCLFCRRKTLSTWRCTSTASHENRRHI